MKILHLIDSGGLYGAEVMLLNLMQEQVLLGLQPVLASIGAPGLPEKALEREARLRGLPVRPFRMIPGPNLAGIAEVLHFARGEEVDLIHSHGFKGNVLLALLPRRIRRLPVVATLHGWTWTGGVNRMMLYEWLDSLALSVLDRVVLVNGAMKEHPRLKGRAGMRMEVVANGIPMLPPCAEPSLELDRGVLRFCAGKSFTVGAIGRLTAEKGFRFLLEGVAALVREGREVQLVIIGEGEERASLEELARELGVAGQLLLPGYLPNAKEYLCLFGALAISSLTEGLPMVLLEAMLEGIPVVSTAVGGVPEALQYGKGGILVPPGDAASLAEGVAAIMDDEEAAGEMATVAADTVRARYSARAMALGYRGIYGEVLEQALKGKRP